MCVHNYSAYEGSIVENISSQIERLCSQIERHCSRCLTAKGRHNGGEARAIKLTRQIFFFTTASINLSKKKKKERKDKIDSRREQLSSGRLSMGHIFWFSEWREKGRN